MQNNRGSNREKVWKELQNVGTKKQGPTAGFEYAIQPDGSVLAELRWKERQQSIRPYKFFDSRSSSSSRLYQHQTTTLASVEASIQSSANRYHQQQQASLPAEPIPAQSITPSSAPSRPPLPERTTSELPGISPEYAEGLPFASPSRRVRNRHNAVYGQHLPNALNSPGCAAKVFGNQAVRQEERQLCQQVLSKGPQNNSTTTMATTASNTALAAPEDDYDALLADIDVDELVSRRQSLDSSINNNHRRSSDSSFHSVRQHQHQHQHQHEVITIDSSMDMSSSSSRRSLDSRRSSGSTFPPMHRANPLEVSTTTTDSSFDYGPWDDTPRSEQSVNNSFARASDLHNPYSSNNNNNNNNNMNSSFASDYSTSTPRNNGQRRDSSNSFADTSNANSYSMNNNNNNNNNNTSENFMPASDNMPTDSRAPLCPGHNVPCRLLTANTSANQGRDFYKCALPEGEGCDFFEWADGVEGSWNNTDDGGGCDTMVAGGDSKDVQVENRHKFGHPSFRLGQKDVIDQAMRGRDVFVLMPTGGGKSLCYQLPAWCNPGLSVIISPLLSLIQDQVQSLTKLGVDSVFLNSTQDYHGEQMEINRRLNETTAHGGIKLLYLTPEKLRNSNLMQSMLKRLYDKNLLSRFVVDEAHCLSDWGHDFRPDYNGLSMLREMYPKVPLMALTATANEKVVNDAIRSLGMRNEYRYRSSFNRPNLHYEVRKKDGKLLDEVATYIASKPRGSGVIYCLSRKNCEQVAEKLQSKLKEKGQGRIRVSFYHAELDPAERNRRHHAWSNGSISVLCATVAFGMGIDKPDVRYVIHYSMPKSITH